jgi:hypothetical protein
MAAWTGHEPDYTDQDEGISWIALAVITATFVILAVWGILAAGGPS